MAHEEHTSAIVQWVGHAAQLAGAWAFGWLWRTNSKVDELSIRMKRVEEQHRDRKGPIFDTKDKVGLLEAKVEHLSEDVKELRSEHRETRDGVRELLARVPGP